MARASNGGFLTRLRRDEAGNTLAIMCAILIPLAAFSGSAIDMARLYVVKVRLQQACDAGALAGRKAMTDTNSATPLDDASRTQAETFFDNNFHQGWFQTTGVSRNYSKTSDSQVQGNAGVTVPMTVMAMFGKKSQTLNVTCVARYDVTDTDVMFVLDTTGSMACLPTDSETTCNSYVNSATKVSYKRPDGSQGYYVTEKSGSRISYLRSAVLSFYDTMALTTDPKTTNVRYGFVTYTSAVNVGLDLYAVSPDYLADSWKYQTRWVTGDYSIGSSSTTNDTTITTAAACSAKAGRSPSTANTYNSDGTAVVTTTNLKSTSSGKTTTYYCAITTQKVGPVWTYGQKSLDTSQFKTGATITDPGRVDSGTTTWQGCVEEHDTTAGATSFDPDNLPADLNPDYKPASKADGWRPMWPDVVYQRNSKNGVYSSGTGSDTSQGDDTTGDPAMDLPTPMQLGYQTCGKRIQRLKAMSRDDVSGYVNASDFRAIGGTYHDTGMIWGTRLINPGGVFYKDTQAPPGRQDPQRVIVFMTDGDMAPNQYIYGMYGVEYFDKRVSGGDFTNLKDYHNARFLAACQAAKDRNIDVWVVAVGQSLTDQLTSCATNANQALYAGTGDDLTAAFQTIAKQVARLRISK